MNAEQPFNAKPHRLSHMLGNSSTALRVGTGSVVGALIIVFFGVVYSHEIFFSDRWDPYKPKYLELWFFTLTIAVLLPVIVRSIKKEMLAWFVRAGTVATIIALVIWLSSLWPITTTEAAYTSIGYAFEENIIPLEIALHLSASTISSLFLLLVAVSRPSKANAFKDSLMLICGSIVLGIGFYCSLVGFGFPGLHIIFWVSICTLAILVSLELIPVFVEHENPVIFQHEIPQSGELGETSNAGKKRSIIFALVLIALCLLVMIFAPKKSLSTLAELIPILIPAVEAIAILCKFIASRLTKRVSPPRAYGNVMISWLAFIVVLVGGVVTLLVAGYYRDLLTTIVFMLPALLAGFVAGHFLRTLQIKGARFSESAISVRYHVMLFLGLGIIIGVSLAGWRTWQLFLYTAAIVIDPRTAPFLGVFGVIPAGFAIGLLVYCGIGSIGEYHRKTVLSKDNEPAWNATATTWLVLLIPSMFYYGQVFFGDRIFEWYAHINSNIDNTASTLFLVGIVMIIIGAFVASSLVIVIIQARDVAAVHEVEQEALSRGHVRYAGIGFIIIVFMTSIVGSTFVMRLPRVEPSWNRLIVQNDVFTLWTTYPASKVSQDYVPGTFQTTATEIEVIMAAGETERVHVILSPMRDIEHLRFNISTFRDPAKNATFPATGINWYYVTYNFDGQEEQLVPGFPYQHRGRGNITSNYLSQINSWRANAGTNQPLWLSFTSAYNTTSASYAGNATLTWSVDGIPDSFIIKFHVVVLAYQKPLAYRFGTFLGIFDPSNALLGQLLWRCDRTGYNPAYPQMIPPSFIQSINWTTGIYVLNFTGFVAALNSCAQAGYMHQRWTSFTDAALAVMNPVPFTASWNATVSGILTLMESTLNTTWFNLPYGQGKMRAIELIYADLYDEPGKDDAYRFRIGQLINQFAPDFKLLCTCGISREAASWPGWTGPGGVFDVVKVRVTGPLSFQEYFDDPYVRQLYVQYPAENWIYWINSPWPPYPNSAQAYDPGSAILSQVIQYYVLTNVTGFLFWTAGDTTWADGGDGYEGWGSGRYFYHVNDGSNSYDVGYRFELLDDGLEIGEMVRHLDALIAGTAGALNATSLAQARSIRAAFNSLFPSFRAYPDPPHVGDLYALRMELLGFLAKNT